MRTPLTFPPDYPPTLIVVVDTEEEFDWSAPFSSDATSVGNIAFQTLAQAIFDRAGVVPTYVVDYPVARSARACAVLRPWAEDGRCEIGAHLHPWVTPPLHGPTDLRHSFAGNLSPELERAKLAVLTQAVASAFGRNPQLYKAGRYGLGDATYGILAELGYTIDLSIVPYTDFSAHHGPDFSSYSPLPWRSDHGITALPLSVGFAGKLRRHGQWLYPRLAGPGGLRLHLPGVAARLHLLERIRLSPEAHSLAELIRLTQASLAAGQRLFMLTYHSSSLLPGGAPYVGSVEERTRFLTRLEDYLAFFLGRCRGRTASVGAVAADLMATGSSATDWAGGRLGAPSRAQEV
jgi:hypothetical protein